MKQLVASAAEISPVGMQLALGDASLKEAVMWIVRLALRRPYTFVVLALLIAVLGVVSITAMSVDVFPDINIPVINVVWNYGGMSPTEMQDRIVTISERSFT